MTDKSKSIIWIIIAVLVYALCSAFCFSEMMFSRPGAQAAVASAEFMIFWVLFLVFNRKRKIALTFSLVCASIILLAALFCSISAVFDHPFSIAIFTLFIITPLTCINYLVSNYTSVFVICAVFAALWFITSIILRIKLRKQIA